MNKGPPWALEQNLALISGAGAGKTHALVTICLHLLGSARKTGPLQPSQLCLVTFTEKAAAELKERLEARLFALALGQAQEGDEEALRACFAEGGRPFPPAEEWRRIHDQLGSAFIGTFHALCIQLLRLAPAGFGVDPGFELLEEPDARGLICDIAERTLLSELERENASVGELCRDLGFSSHGRAQGLVEQLIRVYDKVREEGLSFECLPLSDPAQVRLELGQALERARGALREALYQNLALGGEFGAALSAAEAALNGFSLENCQSPERLGALCRAVQELGPKSKKKDALSVALSSFCEAVEGKNGSSPGILDCCGTCLSAQHEHVLRQVLEEISRRHQEELARQARLDFSELLLRARNLLRDVPLARREAQARFQALLVDEFQDTNPVQLELVLLLSEKREGGPRRLDSDRGDLVSLPLERGFLCAVGDRKQSIYEFRGADVAIFERLAQKIEAEGGRREQLVVNRRSTPALLTFFNGLFARVMAPAPDGQDYEVAYRPEEDDLRAHRSGTAGIRCVERIILQGTGNAAECRAEEAEALARRLHQILRDSGLRVEGRDGARMVQGSDIAMLFRRFSYLEIYRQALLKYGIPHRVVRGGGFYAAQEVLDLSSLLSLLANPGDALAFAAVLRSPFVGLSDASLLKLALSGERKLSLPEVNQKGPDIWGLPWSENQRLRAFLDLHRILRSERDRLGLKSILKLALEETGFRVALAGMPYGEQALANVDKLLSLAARREALGGVDCASFAAELSRLADTDPSEAEAELVEGGDPRAVQLLTVHQSKGLEWPLVVIPDMTVAPKQDNARLLFERHLGLGLRACVAGELRPSRTRRLAELTAHLKRREAAEHRRLLYVALTRARDHLILSGQNPRQSGECWRALADQAVGSDKSLRELVEDVKAAELPIPEPVALEKTQDAGLGARVDAALKRVRAHDFAQPRTLVVTVTQMADYGLCPRRHGYLHLLGLPEHPGSPLLTRKEPEAEAARPLMDPRQRGSLAHRILEKVDFSLARSPKLAVHLETLAAREGLSEESAERREVLQWVKSFLETDFAASVANAPPGRVHRELPFLLKVPGQEGRPSLCIKGQIDLLVEGEVLTVVDYKSGRRRPHSEDAYAFQLRCYALAARQFSKGAKAVRAGLSFLQEAHPGPDFYLMPSEEDQARWQAQLAEAAPDFARAWKMDHWLGRERSVCESIGCGFRYRCHATAAAC